MFSYPVFILISIFFSSQQLQKTEFLWLINTPIFKPGTNGSFDEIAVKDPTIVFYENKWHLFYTARDSNEYTTGYVSAKKMNELNNAKRYELKTIRGKTKYGCAPQIFFFEPQKKWYLIFQNLDSNYQPAFSTNSTISEPDNWSQPKNLIEKDSPKKWIDFWLIADQQKVYLFYTEAHNGVIMRSTNINAFPAGWSKSKLVFENVHEAVHIYKVKNKNEYHLIYEKNNNGIRSFGLAMANQLEGPWQNVTNNYASGEQLIYDNSEDRWTALVSHGEVIRSGYNQLLEYEPNNCRWLIQGLMKKELDKRYTMLPWKLGIITQTKNVE